jgi:hypothetical protein
MVVQRILYRFFPSERLTCLPVDAYMKDQQGLQPALILLADRDSLCDEVQIYYLLFFFRWSHHATKSLSNNQLEQDIRRQLEEGLPLFSFLTLAGFDNPASGANLPLIGSIPHRRRILRLPGDQLDFYLRFIGPTPMLRVQKVARLAIQ